MGDELMSPKEKATVSPAPTAAAQRIDRDTIEAKFRDIQGDVDTVAGDAVNYALVAGAVVAVAIVGVAFWLGKRRGKRKGTVIEVRRH
jgi:hypothetical protein